MCHEVAECLEETIDQGTDHGDESPLMHKYLKKAETEDKPAEGEDWEDRPAANGGDLVRDRDVKMDVKHF